MTDNIRNGYSSPVRPRWIDVEVQVAAQNRINAIESVKERVVEFISKKPGRAIVAGVVLGAALAILVGRIRK